MGRYFVIRCPADLLPQSAGDHFPIFGWGYGVPGGEADYTERSTTQLGTVVFGVIIVCRVQSRAAPLALCFYGVPIEFRIRRP